ncbi:MAG: hypothetical protein RIQ52_1069 [Pseudomonadota bacterium]|jgi:UDP-2,3-diacylglucosamine hydrolase
MASTCLFISDLHLGSGVPQRVQGFVHFLESLGSEIETLYILGDLFDSYIGDDDEAGMALDVRNALGRLALRGVAICFQQGNRDFLLGEYFLLKAGAVLLDDYALVQAAGRHVLLTHGDLLCTDDVQYQSVRKLLRSTEWQRNALAKPLWARRLYARWYRLRSFFSKSRKTGEIMDVNLLKVEEVMRSYQACTLVHGHTHRPDCHKVDLGHGIQGERWVLAEWKDEGEYLLLDHAGFRRVAVTW